MPRCKSTLVSAKPASSTTPAPPAVSPADRPATDTSAPPRLVHPPKKPAPADQKSLSFQDVVNGASDSDEDDNPRPSKLRRKALLESMPVINLGSQAFAPIGEERPKSPGTPDDTMDLDGGAPAASTADTPDGAPVASTAASTVSSVSTSATDVSAADIFGSSDDEPEPHPRPKNSIAMRRFPWDKRLVEIQLSESCAR